MDLLLTIFVLLASIGVGWSIGANDAANSLGPAVGSKVLTLRQGIGLITLFGLLGALLQGSHVVKTIGTGIVPMDTLSRAAALSLAVAASIATVAWVFVATYWKMPVSTSHAIVGAVAGAGLALGAPVNWQKFLSIFICWIATPLGAAVLSLLLYYLLKTVIYWIFPARIIDRVIIILIILSGCYVAYTWGANDVANATGVISGTGVVSQNWAVIIGGLAIVLGIVTWGYKVIETIGGSITNLVPIMALAAQLGSAFNVHLYTLCGIPVSTSHSIVGAIFGVGLAKGMKVLNKGIMKDIVVCWLATPLISCLISFLLLKGIIGVIKF